MEGERSAGGREREEGGGERKGEGGAGVRILEKQRTTREGSRVERALVVDGRGECARKHLTDDVRGRLPACLLLPEVSPRFSVLLGFPYT